MKVCACILSPAIARGIAVICAAVLVTSAASTALAAGVVGTGTAASCTDAALNAALDGGGLVTFNCGGPATIDISIGTGTKTIAADTTIDGGGLIAISGGNAVGVFRVLDAINFTVENVTIANGRYFPADGIEPVGGGIFNGSGLLTVTNTTFAGNTAYAGGGIFSSGVSSGSLIVTSSTFVDNSATAGGGAIYNGIGTLTVTNSTFTGNSALSGGGIAYVPTCLSCGSLTIINSTFTSNSASQLGADVSSYYFEGPGAPAMLRNTILANSPSGENCFGNIIDGGHNIDDGRSCGFSVTKGSSTNTNPQLDPAGLQNNGGGPTQTIALGPDSPAIDAGELKICAAPPVHGVDQRGFVRPGTGHTNCSIGAYEADAAPCTGDCDGNGMVAINELIVGVNIDLGVQPATACSAFPNSEGLVDIAQLIKGVDNALDGCGG